MMSKRTTVVILLTTVIVAFAVIKVDLAAFLSLLLYHVEESGALGVLLFVGLYIVSNILMIPGSILTFTAGVVYGVFPGAVYVSIASTLGAIAAFLVGRYITRDLIANKLSRSPRFAALHRAVSTKGWRIVFLGRLSPLIPYNLSNYAYGLTGISVGSYALASWAGMLPGTIVYVYVGSILGELAQGTATRERAMSEHVLTGVGLVATVAVTVMLARRARRALAEVVE